MKILVTGDWHFAFDRVETPYESERVNKVLASLKNIVDTHQPDASIFLGDFAKGKQRVTYKGVARLLQGLDILTKSYILLGNHDISSESSLLSEESSQYKVIAKPLCIERTPKVDWLFLPYGCSLDDMQKAVAGLNPQKIVYVFGHFGLNGASFGTGTPFVAIDEVPPSLFDVPNIKHIYLGHYHLRQTVGKVTYVGSPWQVTFGEEADDKYVLILTEDEAGILSEEWVTTDCNDLETISVNDIPSLDKYLRINFRSELERESFLAKYPKAKIVQWVFDEEEDIVSGKMGVSTDEFMISPEKIIKLYGEQESLTEKQIKLGLNLMRKAVNDF